MGNTGQGAVWLNDDMLSPFDYWQFWRNTDDADVLRYMKIFTDFSNEDLARYATLQGADINTAKIALADAATAMCHGENVLSQIHIQVQAAFGSGSETDLPTKWLEISQIDSPTLETILVTAGLMASKGEAKRLAQGGGLRINGEQVMDARQEIDLESLRSTPIKISLGKKQHCLVQVK